MRLLSQIGPLASSRESRGSGQSASRFAYHTAKIQMIDALTIACGRNVPAVTLIGKIMGAADLDDLWHFRPEVMNCLASSLGESAASEIMRLIDSTFHVYQRSAIASTQRQAKS